MIEKILEKIEELRGNICTGIPCNGCDYNKDCYEGEHAENRAIDLCKKIVQEVVKEYGTVSDNDLAVVSALPSLYPLKPFEEESIHKVVASAKDGGWIPCSERLPEKHTDVLVAVNDDCVIAWYSDVNKHWKNSSTDIVITGEVIAWQPLPAPYQKGE